MNKNKNSFIEILRFVFCMVIFMHHSGFFSDGSEYPFMKAGFYAVEFFFILTGALSMPFVYRTTKNDEIMKASTGYTINKLKRIFPYALCGIVLSYIWYFIQADTTLSIKDRIFGRWNIIYEILFLPMTGVMNVDLNSYLNSPLWYLSVILIVLPLILYIAIRFNDVYCNYLCIFIPLMMHGYLINKYDGIGSWGQYSGIVFTGVIRGAADLMIGSLVFILSKKIVTKSTISKVIYTFVEAICYIFALYTFNTSVDGYTYEFAILIMALGMSISLSGQTYTSLVKGRIFNILGTLSLPIYCIHWPVYKLVSLYAPQVNYVSGVIITLCITVIVSVLMLIVVNRISKKV